MSILDSARKIVVTDPSSRPMLPLLRGPFICGLGGDARYVFVFRRSEECRRRHEKDARTRNDVKVFRKDERMDKAIVKMSTGVPDADKTVVTMISEDAQVLRASEDIDKDMSVNAVPTDYKVTDCLPRQHKCGRSSWQLFRQSL